MKSRDYVFLQVGLSPDGQVEPEVVHMHFRYLRAPCTQFRSLTSGERCIAGAVPGRECQMNQELRTRDLRRDWGVLPEPAGNMPDAPEVLLALTHEVVEGTGDAHDLVDGPGPGLDRDDEEVAGDTGSPRLGRDRREAKAAWRVAVGEGGELDSAAVLGDDEDLLLVTIGDEETVARTQTERSGHRSTMDGARKPLRSDSHDFPRSLLGGELGIAVGADPELIPVVDREEPWPRKRQIPWIDHAALRIEANDAALGAMGVVHVAARVPRRPFGLPQARPTASLRRAAGEQFGAPVDEPIERPDLPLAVEGGDEQLAPTPRRSHLRIRQRRAVEVARLGVGAQSRAARGNPIDGPEVVRLAAEVAPARPRQVEEAGVIERQGGGGRDAADAPRGVGVEAFTRHVHLGREPGRQPQLVRHRERDQQERQGEEAGRHRAGRFQMSRSCISRIWRRMTFSRYSACFIGARFK